jgi:uncharacterized membrane protein YkvA (DUF1232 family)
MSKKPLPAPDSRFELSEALNRHLSATTVDGDASISRYLERGGDIVDSRAQEVMHRLLPALGEKMAEAGDSTVLTANIQALELYFRECHAGRQPLTPALRETTFALLYFIKGFDRIPDSVPEVGFLDDALVAQTVIQRHRAALRAHWLRRGRTWPAEL